MVTFAHAVCAPSAEAKARLADIERTRAAEGPVASLSPPATTWTLCQDDLERFDMAKFHAEQRADKAHDGVAGEAYVMCHKESGTSDFLMKGVTGAPPASRRRAEELHAQIASAKALAWRKAPTEPSAGVIGRASRARNPSVHTYMSGKK